MVTVRDVLEDARALGFLGPGPVERHVVHARAFARALSAAPRHAVDLGSGGGVPGLVLAEAWPGAVLTMVEVGERRAKFLSEAVVALGIAERVRVVAVRAEQVGRDPTYRGSADVVVARGFGPPAVTAECAAPLLVVGGHLVVSEPPRRSPARWPVDQVRELGMVPVERVEGEGGTMQLLLQVATCPVRFPRRVGIPAKRPLF